MDTPRIGVFLWASRTASAGVRCFFESNCACALRYLSQSWQIEQVSNGTLHPIDTSGYMPALSLSQRLDPPNLSQSILSMRQTSSTRFILSFQAASSTFPNEGW